MNKYNRPIKEICQANSKFNIIQQKTKSTSSCSANYLLKEGKVSKRQKSKQKKYSPMDDQNKNLRNLYKNHNGSLDIERQQLLDKENYLKLYSCNNEKNNENSSSNNVSHGGLAYNNQNHPDDTGSGRCIQDDLIENQCDAHVLEQEQSIFCTTYNQYHTVNSNLSNISVKIHNGSTVNSNNNISKKKS